MPPIDWSEYPHLHNRMFNFFADEIVGYDWCSESAEADHVSEANATDGYGKPVTWDDKNAAAFNLLGCAYKLYRGTPNWGIITRYLYQVFDGQLLECALLEFNDKPGRTKMEILAFLSLHKL